MARDESIDPMTYPRDCNDFLDLQPADLVTLRVAFSADLGLAPTSKMIRRVFGEKTSRFRHQFRDSAEEHPNLATAARVNWVLRGMQYLALHKDHYTKHRDKLGPNVILNYEQALELTVDEIVLAFKEHGELHKKMDHFFQEFDLLICPGATVGPFPVEDLYVGTIDGMEMETYVSWAGLTNALSTTGNPVVSLPCGKDEDGMPFGFQIVGPRRSDAYLLGVAKALEQVFQGDPELARPVPPIAAAL